MKNMQLTKNKILNLLLSLCIVLRCLPMITVSSTENQHVHSLASANSDCLVCDLAYKINSLPTAEEITSDDSEDKVEEASELIQDIDAIKFDLTDEEYYELEELVGKNVPKYFEAIQALQSLRGSIDLTIDKSIVLSNGERISAADERLKDYSVSFEIEPVVGTSALSTNMLIETDLPDQNSAKTWVGPAMTYDLTYNTDSSHAIGLTNTYSLPAGTYKIRETNLNKPFVIDGKTYYTTSVTYKYNGQELSEGSTITLSAGATNVLEVSNAWGGESDDISEEVLIPDENLRAALRQALIDNNIIVDREHITKETLGQLEGQFSLYDTPVATLQGLEWTNYQEITIWSSNVSDVRAEYFPESLTDLYLYGHQLKSMPDLSSLTALKTLDLDDGYYFNSDSSMECVDAGTIPLNVTRLRLYCNRLKEVPADLINLTGLTDLDLHENQILDMSPIGRLEAYRNDQIAYLSLGDQTISCTPRLGHSVPGRALETDVLLATDIDGTILYPTEISNEGVYDQAKNTITWNYVPCYNEYNIPTVLSYSFSGTEGFSARVEIPIVEKITQLPGYPPIPRMMHYCDGDKKYVPIDNEIYADGIVWLQESIDGDETWFGLELPDNAIQNIDMSNKYFYVEWISPEEMLTHPEYANLDPEEKAKIQESRGKLFYAGIADEHGNKIDVEFSSDNPAKLYVKVGSDWETHDLQSVFITADKDQPVEVSYDETVKDPEGGDGYAVMNLTHFSPYFVYDAETSGVGDSPIQAPSGSGDSSSENDSEEKLEEDDSEELQDDYNNLESVLKDFFITGDSKTKIIAWSSVGLILTAFGVLVFMKKYRKIK